MKSPWQGLVASADKQQISPLRCAPVEMTGFDESAEHEV
jgi:hypothetical protein